MPLKLTQLSFDLDKSILTRRVLHLHTGPADVQAALHQAAAKLRPSVEVPGFRSGKAPVAQVLRHHRGRVQAQALATLRQSALDEILPRLDQADQPLTPPQPQGKPPRLRRGQSCTITVSYLVDPTGIARNPEQPQAGPGAVIPGSQALAAIPQPMGIPAGPRLPQAPDLPGLPGSAMPAMPQDAWSSPSGGDPGGAAD